MDDTATRAVRRDEVLGDTRSAGAGRGTYVEGEAIRAMYDGELQRDEAGNIVVTRPRKPLPRARSARTGEDGTEPVGKIGGRGTAHGGRHGAGRHGKPGGRPRRSRGDQGTWN